MHRVKTNSESALERPLSTRRVSVECPKLNPLSAPSYPKVPRWSTPLSTLEYSLAYPHLCVSVGARAQIYVSRSRERGQATACARARECTPEYTKRVRPKCRQCNPIECPTEYPLWPLGTHVCRLSNNLSTPRVPLEYPSSAQYTLGTPEYPAGTLPARRQSSAGPHPSTSTV
jgi:hypothetical protein